MEYLKQVSITEPFKIRVEETEKNRIVLSFQQEEPYMWSDRLYKEFVLKDGKVLSMKTFENK